MQALAWAITMLLAGMPVSARSSSGGWEVEEVDHGCAAMTTFYGGTYPTRLSIGQMIDDRFMLVLQNTGWSTVEGKPYDVYLLIDGNLFEGKATGGTSGALILQLDPKIMKAIMVGSRLAPALKIDANSERMLEVMQLTGTSAAMSRVRSCLVGMRAAKQRAERVPQDPFRP